MFADVGVVSHYGMVAGAHDDAQGQPSQHHDLVDCGADGRVRVSGSKELQMV